MTTIIEAIDIRFAGSRITSCAKNEKHFAGGVNFYKLFWIFVLGSFFGYIVETMWCFLEYGHFESRSSLVFAPFTIIYGIGALVLYVGLYKINKKNLARIFIFGMAAGTLVEYICSWAQEVAFGRVSWDYSGVLFNINGRVCLLYSAFWGVLALLWIKLLLPMLENIISKIPNSTGKMITWCLFMILIVCAVISIAAVTRWMMRIDGVPATGSWITILDNFFPNARMESIYANMITN